MGNTLRLSVVAEGVEESSQHAYLVKHRCSLFQGYLFGRPMSFDDFQTTLGTCPLPEPETADNWVI